MRYYICEDEAAYMDIHHGQFSKKLAEYAISNMKAIDEETQELSSLKPHPIEEMEEALKKYNIRVKEEHIYTAWYLYNMAFADYPEALPNKEAICYFIKETINDPDCKPASVLACYRAKMDVMGTPINWGRFI